MSTREKRINERAGMLALAEELHHVLRDRALPYCEEHGTDVRHLHTGTGRGYCGRPPQHPFDLVPTVNRMTHRRTEGRAQLDVPSRRIWRVRS